MTSLAISSKFEPVVDETTLRWAERISRRWTKSVISIIETGRLITEAKIALPHGQFLLMVREKLPFGERVAQHLMRVSRDARINNPKFLPYLPASYARLTEMARLNDEDFAIEVAQLRLSTRKRSKEKPPMYSVFGRDIRKTNVAELKRIVEALTKIVNHIGAADSTAALGEVISDAWLDEILN